MRIDPALRALRSDDTPQRLAQECLAEARDRWREKREWRAIADAFAAYGDGAVLEDCHALREMLTDPAKSEALAHDFIAHFLPAVAQAPLALFPLRHAVNGSFSTLLLAASGKASLLLMMMDGTQLAERNPAQAVGFVAGERHEVIVSGRARGRRVRCQAALANKALLEISPIELEPGTTLSVDTACETMLVEEVDGVLVSLRLQRRGEGLLTARDYALADGALVHQAAGDADQSRQELMLSLLGRMGRKDAAPVMADLTRTGTDGMRWQALRECLALDTQVGFAALTALARNADDALAAPAGALRAQLLEAHPVLTQLEEREAACPV